MFSSHEFGIYSTILAIISTVTVGTILKLDQALPIAKENERESLIRIGFLINTLVSFIILIVFLIIVQFHESEILNIHIIICISLSILVNGFSNMLIGLNVSLGNFSINARYQVYRSISLTGLQLLFGTIGFLKFGLIYAFLFSQTLTLIYLVIIYKNSLSNVLKLNNILEDYYTLKLKYFDFVCYLTPSSLIRTFGTNLPSMLFSVTYGISYSGLYGLVTRAFMTPLYMVSISIAQPFIKNLSDVQNSSEEIKNNVLKTFKLLSLISILPISLYTFNMEFIFTTLFSDEWKNAGKLAIFILPWIIVNFILSPISHVYTVTRTQNQNLLFNISMILLEVIIISYSQLVGISFFKMIAIFGLTNLLLALGQLLNIFYIVKLKKIFLITRIVIPLFAGIIVSYSINVLTDDLISIIVVTLIVASYFIFIKNEMIKSLK